MPVGYLPDLFGHVGQMPQIWRQFGLDNTILWRGFGGPNAEYWWDAPDGSRLLMMHLPPEGYCNATRIVFDPDAMMARATEKIDFERARTRTGQALLMNGVDHVEPHTAIPALIEQLSAVPGSAPSHSTLPDYVAAVRNAVEQERPPLDTIVGELRGGTDYANLLPGVLSARVYLKQQNAHVQTLLESYAEPLSVMALASRSGVAPEVAQALGLPPYPRPAPPRLEDAAAEPSARQHLRLQHRRGARREHDAIRARTAGRRCGRRERARRDCRRGAGTLDSRRDPRRRRQHGCGEQRAGRGSFDRSCRSTARSRGARSTRRPSTAR